MRKAATLSLLAALLLAGCDSMSFLDRLPLIGSQRAATASASAPVPAAPAPPPPDPQTVMAPLETRIAILTEEQREKIDPQARRLAIDPELSRIARERAADMAAKNYLAHAGPNGDTSASLLMAEDGKWQGLLGENLAAQHYNRDSGVDVEEFAKRFLDTWLNSPPHRDNLSFPQYDRTGVGAAVNGDTVYVAQLFASDLGLPRLREGTDGGRATTYDSVAAAQADAPRKTEPLRLRGAIGAQP
jgi:uncharacterized protein YkwD